MRRRGHKPGELRGRDRRRRREAVITRDGPGCHWCGSEDDSTLDHVVPTSAGGTNRIENLVLSCEPCNQSRGGIHGAGAYPEMVGKSARPRAAETGGPDA